MALIAGRAGDQVLRALADRVDVVVALRTSARHHGSVRKMRALERVGRVTGITGLGRRNVIARHVYGRKRIALDMAGRALFRHPGEDAMQMALLAARTQMLAVERETGRLVIEV